MKQVLTSLMFGLMFSVPILGASLALVYLQARGLIAGDVKDLSVRIIGVISGLLVAWLANAMPKRMRPLDQTACDPVKEQSGRRFVATAVVIGGLLYSVAWLAAPMELALPLSITAMGGAIVIAIARCLMLRARS